MNVIADRIVRKNPFLRDWSNYGIVDIFNPVATAQYQHSVTIPTKPGMMHDFRDLRFFQPDGTEIPFWNESKTDGSTAFVWFKPYSVSNRQAYVFYGNREAVSQSSGDKTFEFFDDFLGSVLDTTKWNNWRTNNGTSSVAASVLTINPGTSNYNTIGARTQFVPQNYAFRFKAYASADPPTAGSNGAWNMGIDDRSATGSAIGSGVDIAFFDASSGTKQWTNFREGTSHVSPNRTSTLTSYAICEIASTSTSSITYSVNGSVERTDTSFIPQDACGFEFQTQYSGSLYIDWCAVRKHTATEPVCQLNQSGLRNPEYR